MKFIWLTFFLCSTTALAAPSTSGVCQAVAKCKGGEATCSNIGEDSFSSGQDKAGRNNSCGLENLQDKWLTCSSVATEDVFQFVRQPGDSRREETIKHLVCCTAEGYPTTIRRDWSPDTAPEVRKQAVAELENWSRLCVAY